MARRISENFPTQSLLRCHPPPNAKSLADFVDYLNRMGFANMDASSAGALQRSMDSIADPEMRQILMLLAVKPMQRATYFCTGDSAEGQWRHYALNFDCYTVGLRFSM